MARVEEVAAKLAQTKVEDAEELDFSGKGLKLDTEKDAQEIINEINKCKRLSSLRLEGNTLGIDAAKGIAKALESHPEFQFALWKDMFTGRLKNEIPDALTYLGSGLMLAGAKLVELDLSDNAFGPIGVEGIQVLLKSPCCFQLQILRLNNNGLGIGGGKMLAKALLDCHKTSTENGTPFALRVFMCGRNRLENAGAKALAAFFTEVKSLEEVIMPQNGIYHEGIKALAEAFAKNTNLRLVNLNDNTFTNKGGIAMAQAVSSLQRLEILNVGDCLVRSEGAKAIAAAIKDEHRSLKELHLGYNEIDLEAAKLVAKAVQGKSNFVKLDLDGNKFGNDGCEDLRHYFDESDRKEVLGSLSNDEGSGSENEDDDDNDDEEDDDDDDDDDDDNDENISNGHKEDETEEKGMLDEKLSSELKKATLVEEDEERQHIVQISIEEFLKNPSTANLKNLGKEEIISHVKGLGNTRNLDDMVSLFIKICSCVDENDAESKKLAFKSADAVLSQCFQYASCEKLSLLSNSLLVHLGMIKSEDKKFVPAKDLLGPLIVLEHVVRQPYFCSNTKEILQLFLSRPNKAVEACGNAKHKLMQSLYRF